MANVPRPYRMIEFASETGVEYQRLEKQGAAEPTRKVKEAIALLITVEDGLRT